MKINPFAHAAYIGLALLILPLSWSVCAVIACIYLSIEGTLFLLNLITKAVPERQPHK